MTLCGGAHVCGGLLYRRDSGPHSFEDAYALIL